VTIIIKSGSFFCDWVILKVLEVLCKKKRTIISAWFIIIIPNKYIVTKSYNSVEKK
jgi:hypothetical protein